MIEESEESEATEEIDEEMEDTPGSPSPTPAPARKRPGSAIQDYEDSSSQATLRSSTRPSAAKTDLNIKSLSDRARGKAPTHGVKKNVPVKVVKAGKADANRFAILAKASSILPTGSNDTTTPSSQ